MKRLRMAAAAATTLVAMLVFVASASAHTVTSAYLTCTSSGATEAVVNYEYFTPVGGHREPITATYTNGSVFTATPTQDQSPPALIIPGPTVANGTYLGVTLRWAEGSFTVQPVRLSCQSTPPPPTCTPPAVMQNGKCVVPPPVCVPPQVMENGHCVTPPPPPVVCTPPAVMQGGTCVTPTPPAPPVVPPPVVPPPAPPVVPPPPPRPPHHQTRCMRHHHGTYSVTFVPNTLLTHGTFQVVERGPKDVTRIVTLVKGAKGGNVNHRYRVVRHGNTAVIVLDVTSAREFGLSRHWDNTTWGVHCIYVTFYSPCGHKTIKVAYLNNN